MTERGMGKGLGAILGSTAALEERGGDGLRHLDVGLIDPNPNQPRKHFDSDALQALADSIRESGVLQPVLVRPVGARFELVAGERRWRAAQLADLSTVPCVVADRDADGSLEAAVIENMAREDLNPIEEARALAALVEDAGLSREQVGRRVGRSRSAISNLLRILDLPPETIALVEQGSLTEGHARALLLADDHGARRSLGRSAATDGWSVRVTEEKARASNAASGGHAERSGVHPDARAAAEQISDRLSAALGVEVKVRPRGTGFKAELLLDDPEEALALANRISALTARSA